MEQRGHPEIVELDLGESQLLAQSDREDADVHRVGERVLVVVADRGHAHHGHFVVEDLVHHQLHRPFHPLEPGRRPSRTPAITSRVTATPSEYTRLAARRFARALPSRPGRARAPGASPWPHPALLQLLEPLLHLAPLADCRSRLRKICHSRRSSRTGRAGRRSRRPGTSPGCG